MLKLLEFLKSVSFLKINLELINRVLKNNCNVVKEEIGFNIVGGGCCKIERYTVSKKEQHNTRIW